ncbi:MAG: hypothetical protein WD061_03350 [Candidatus Saccharimonadales bacterium]
MDFNNANFRATVVFVVVGLILWAIMRIIAGIGISLFGSNVLVLIGAGWTAYWVWKKTEHGRY